MLTSKFPFNYLSKTTFSSSLLPFFSIYFKCVFIFHSFDRYLSQICPLTILLQAAFIPQILNIIPQPTKDGGDAMRSRVTINVKIQVCNVCFCGVINFKLLCIHPYLLEIKSITFINYFENLLCENSKIFVKQTWSSPVIPE